MSILYTYIRPPTHTHPHTHTHTHTHRELDFDWSFCEKKIRIAFYVQPPFIIVDPTKCKKDPQDESAARLCPPEAFGDKPSDDNKQQPMFDG